MEEGAKKEWGGGVWVWPTTIDTQSHSDTPRFRLELLDFISVRRADKKRGLCVERMHSKTEKINQYEILWYYSCNHLHEQGYKKYSVKQKILFKIFVDNFSLNFCFDPHQQWTIFGESGGFYEAWTVSWRKRIFWSTLWFCPSHILQSESKPND